MAKARVHLMIQDPETARYKGMPPTEGFDIDGEDFFLDGPVTRRVAVLDFEPESGDLAGAARFEPPKPGGTLGRYANEGLDVHSPEFLQVNTFGTVFKTMYMFEDPENLGRRVTWGFEGPQLLVIPRAGVWANAFYERESRSVQLYYFDALGRRVFTALSRDIIAHETGHAVLDGIAPHLYHALTPQSLAMHEAVADITALLVAFLSDKLRETVLDQTGGSIQNSTAFSGIAEEFGQYLDPEKRAGSLRNLLNDLTLDPTGAVPVDRAEPHQLSQVLGGALYAVMVKIHEAYRERYLGEGDDRRTADGRALSLGSRLFRRMVLRALDYLPPGEVSFADLGRAIIAADQAAHPDRSREREWIVEEFVRRHMAPDPAALEVETDVAEPALRDLDLDLLMESDWAAYRFANENRALLRIPPEVPFRILPRQAVRKRLFLGEGEKAETHECLFKVAWDHTEPNLSGAALPPSRQVAAGTMLAIDWDTRRLRACLTSERSDEQRLDRDRMLLRLLDHDALRLDRLAIGPDGQPLRTVVRAQALGDVMRVRGTARTLHVAPEQP